MALRYVIYGAGAIGGTIGGRLAQNGHDVVLIARGEHGHAIRQRGLTLVDPDARATIDIRCVERPDGVTFAGDDVVILGMKTHDTAAALDELSAAAHRDTPVVCAQNGVENERLALRRFRRVYGMCVMLPAQHLEAGVVEVSSAPISGILDLGRYPTGADDVAGSIAADLASSTFSARPDEAVMRRKYAKLLMNLGNSLEAACGPAARSSLLFRRAREEAAACFEAAGIDVASDDEDRQRRGELLQMRPIAGRQRGGGSSWQSLARGAGRIETDYLNGEIVLLGRVHGVATPVNEAMQELANRLAREGAPPGSVDVAELEARLL